MSGCAGCDGAGARLRRLFECLASGIRQSGAFELKQATWAFRNAIASPEAAADPVMKAALEAENISDWFARMPWKPGHSPLRHHPDYEAYLFDQWRARRLRRLLAKGGDFRRRLVRPLQQSRVRAPVVLVRPVSR